MEIEGRIIADLPLQQGVSKAGNPWKKKEWVLETFGNYAKKVKFDFFGDRVDSNHLELGKMYAISFDLESREFNGRWYTDVRAYAAREIQGPSAGAGYPQQPYGQPAAPAAAPFGQPASPSASPFGAAPAAPSAAPDFGAASAAPFDAASGETDDLPF